MCVCDATRSCHKIVNPLVVRIEKYVYENHSRRQVFPTTSLEKKSVAHSALPWYAFLDSFLGELHLQLQSLSLQQRLN